MPENLTPDESARKKQVQSDIERAAALGGRLAEQEKERKKKRASAAKREEAVAHDILQQDLEVAEQKKEQAKQFRTTKKERDAEVERDVARRKAEADRILQEQAERKAEQEKRRQYMKELQLQAAIKKKKIDRDNAVAKEKKSIRASAELHYRETVDAATRARRDAEGQLEHSTREHLMTIDTELKKSLYTLEQTHRSRMTGLDGEEMRIGVSRTVESPAVQRQKEQAKQQLKLKRKKLEDDFAASKQKLAQEANLKKTSIQNDARDQHTEIDRSFHKTVNEATTARNRELGTIGDVGREESL